MHVGGAGKLLDRSEKDLEILAPAKLIGDCAQLFGLLAVAFRARLLHAGHAARLAQEFQLIAKLPRPPPPTMPGRRRAFRVCFFTRALHLAPGSFHGLPGWPGTDL